MYESEGLQRHRFPDRMILLFLQYLVITVGSWREDRRDTVREGHIHEVSAQFVSLEAENQNYNTGAEHTYDRNQDI
ncbi:hypothetical protein DM02DRAFT_607893 [Periconia macrospinosa]|uniref:Uncharacterized protein n=1 Tax=Periconia macrospinosa TaxID=97972 RepID=A0A2V1EFH9_9PLEO|nr:hypothetical protein DM02DRAFT_607893 [Periconia macrospinosa]